MYVIMDANDFIKDLNDAQEFMRNEKYSDALFILGKLKEADKAGNFDYNLTHKLYQLFSNSQSLYNQQKVLSTIQKISHKQKSISFQKLKEILKEHENLDLDDQVLRREVEILDNTDDRPLPFIPGIAEPLAQWGIHAHGLDGRFVQDKSALIRGEFIREEPSFCHLNIERPCEIMIHGAHGKLDLMSHGFSFPVWIVSSPSIAKKKIVDESYAADIRMTQ